MRKFATEIVSAWRARTPRRVGRYSTDGTTVYAWGTPVATRSLDGRRFILERTRGDGSNHLLTCLRAAFPRSIAIEKIDMYYSSIYEPTIHYPPRRVAHKIRVGRPPGRDVKSSP